MALTLKQKLSLKKFIKELANIRGRHTELVSVYIPQGYDLIKIIKHLQQEQGTATNIKDSRTRKNVIDSLEKCIRHLRLYKKTPENGLAVFAGDVSQKESQIDIKVWSIEPLEPIKTRMYRCDQTFVLNILEDMLEVKETYGLIILDNREASIGLLKGTSIIELVNLTSGVPGKVKAGGFSQARYARLREEAANEFYDRIGEAAKKEFFEMKELKGIILGGPGPTKEYFLEGDHLIKELKKKVIGMKDLGYTGEFGLQELVEKSKDLLIQEEITKEKNLMQQFFELLNKDTGKAIYGKEKVDKALELGAIEILLLSESLDDKEIEDYENKANNYGTKVEIISVETREGMQLKGIGGIAAILRFVIS